MKAAMVPLTLPPVAWRTFSRKPALGRVETTTGGDHMKRTNLASKHRLGLGASLLAFGAALTGGGLAHAQDAPAAAPAQAEADSETVVVTGYRASLRTALDTKRESAVVVDVINAEDIADFPDANLAESLQRVPGISIDRDNGEGRTITVRGLG